MRLDNLVGKRFGKLVVIERDNTSQRVRWICQCDCGARKSVAASHLKDGHITTCGDYKRHPRIKPIDLVGQKFGFLTVIQRANIPDSKRVYWECLCDCGNISIVDGVHLKDGHSKSCGKCGFAKLEHPWNFVDLTGRQFGYLTVEEYMYTNSHEEAVWKCRCKCGGTKEVTSHSLTDGIIWQCGCEVRSLGEITIASILDNNNIHYKDEYTLANLFSNKKRLLRYDFAILDNNCNPVRFIEYDGQQHFYPIEMFGGEAGFKARIENDKIKNQYAKEHNIPLIRIPYWHLHNITFETLFNDRYLYKEEL